MTERVRVKVPEAVKKGAVIEIKTLIAHEMETGFRKNADGQVIPRHIINTFTATFNGKPVFSVDLEPAIAPNPYIKFTARIEESGTFRFSWVDDDGTVTTAEQNIAVT
jgi:sulfur-oxidizing protein SoxZ